jgi:hypothetical protein
VKNEKYVKPVPAEKCQDKKGYKNTKTIRQEYYLGFRFGLFVSELE